MEPKFNVIALSARPVKQYYPAKVREWDAVSVELRACLDELCQGQARWPLFLHGPIGTGKTCAALCLVDRIAHDARVCAIFWPMPEYVAHVERVRAGRAEWYDCGRGGTLTEKMWWSRIERLPLLVLDDIGLRETSPDHHMETLFLTLQAREGRPLICTSNLNETDVATSYNERIRSRLCTASVFELRGRDRREDQPDPRSNP